MSREMIVSASKLKTYMECPAQYYWRYVAKRPEKPSSETKSVTLKDLQAAEARKALEATGVKIDERVEQEPSVIFDSGSIVHRVLELAARRRITNATVDKKVTKKELLTLLESVASEPPKDDWRRPLVISPETIETAAKVLSLCWKSINFPFTIQVEYPFSVPIGPVEDDMGNVVVENVKLNGVIDRIDKLPNGHVKIVDYKSGWSVMSRADAEHDPQVNFYLVVGKSLFPHAEIDMELRYLNRGIRLGPIHYTETRRDWLLNAYVKPIVARMATWTKYPETPGSPQCFSCPRKSECASFASMVKGSLGPVTADMGKNLALYDKLGDVEGNIKLLKEQLKPFINAAVEKADDGEIFAGMYKAKVNFRNSTQYHDIRSTAKMAAKAIIDAGKADSPPVTSVEIPSDTEALKAVYAKVVEENTRLKALALESATAFEVACKIAKVQAGLVNEFVEALPESVTLQVAEAIEHTATNGGFYMLDVEKLAIPFHDRSPNATEIEEATRQEERRKLIPAGARPIIDDSHEIDVEAIVVEKPKAITVDSESRALETETAVVDPALAAAPAEPTAVPVAEPKKGSRKPRKAKEAPAPKAEEAPVAKPEAVAPKEEETPASTPDASMSLFPEPSQETDKPSQETDKPSQEADKPSQEAGKPSSDEPEATSAPAWAQEDCKACGGSGLSSRGSPCGPCVSASRKIEAGA